MGQHESWQKLIVTSITILGVVTTVAVADEADLKERFGELQFAPPGGFILRQGQQLPNLAWEQPELIATVVDDTEIPTRWFNERFEEVKVAKKPGRDHHVVEKMPGLMRGISH